MMDVQTAIDRISETENLTDSLGDDAANYLLKWGISQVPQLINESKDDATANAKITQLMAVMRTINQIVSICKSKPVEQVAEELRSLQNSYATLIFGSAAVALADAARRQLAATICNQDERLAVENIIKQLKPTV